MWHSEHLKDVLGAHSQDFNTLADLTSHGLQICAFLAQ